MTQATIEKFRAPGNQRQRQAKLRNNKGNILPERLTGEKCLLEAIAHDLRGPISSILLFSELLADEEFDRLTVPQKELVSDIRASGELALKLTADLLEVATIDAGRLELETVDLVSVLRDCISANQPLADRKGIRLEVRCGVRPPAVRLDRGKICRLVSDVLKSAIGSASLNRGIELSLAVTAQYVRIAVHAEQPENPTEGSNRLFASLSPAVRKVTDLGLRGTLANAIITAHQGHMGVSQGGAGSTVTISLPMDLGQAKNRLKRKASASH